MPNIIHYSPEALQDLDDIYDYILIEKQNPNWKDLYSSIL